MPYTRNQMVELFARYQGAQRGSARHRDLVNTFNRVRPHGQVMNYTAPWCATAVTAIAIKGGYKPSNYPMGYNCSGMIDDARRLGMWEENDNFIPRKADLIIYYWSAPAGNCNAGSSHIGQIISVNKTEKTMTVREGNKGSGVVDTRTVPFGWRYIRGFITPRYTKKVKAYTYKPTKPYSGELPTDDVYYGKKNSNVKKLQEFLNWCCNEKLVIDGSCGTATEEVIFRFQATYNLEQDGCFGPKCRIKAKAIVEALKPKDTPKKSSGEKSEKASKHAPLSKQAQKINDAALKLTWPKGTKVALYKYKGGNPTDEFKKEWKKHYKGRKNSAGCDQAVALVLAVAGCPKMPWDESWDAMIKYFRKNFQEIPVNFKEEQIHGGDIRIHCKIDSKGRKSYHIWVEALNKKGKLLRIEANQSDRYFHVNRTNSATFSKHNGGDWLFRAR